MKRPPTRRAGGPITGNPGGPITLAKSAHTGPILLADDSHYQATLALGDTISTLTAAASGPIAALTEMLYERGITVETMSFHQLPTGGLTATFIEGCDGRHSEWAMGLADDPIQSALSAVIACANRLMTAA